MNLLEAIEQRHSVRSYEDRPLDAETAKSLEGVIRACNAESGLHIQLVQQEPRAFDNLRAHYGKFSGVTNYLALVGKKSSELDELCGYYGEQVVLAAQQMGLNTRWVGGTYKKISSAFAVESAEKLVAVIALGYGITSGRPHKSKTVEEVSSADGPMPQWFEEGVKAALLAPTAVNQQKFKFVLDGKSVIAKAGWGMFNKTDLGIAKYHFEIGAGIDNFTWA